MTTDDLQARCEQGQAMLMETRYLEAEKVLADAEQQAWVHRDYDTLARLYMPLQEARRQRRQCCGEGVVCLDLLAEGPGDEVDGRRVVENYPHGQLLVAGWGSIEPARQVRRLQAEHGLYVETFLAAVYPVGDRRAVVIPPLEHVEMPAPTPQSIDELMTKLPPHCMVMHEDELPRGSQSGTPDTFAKVMAIWERLHTPFLAAADMQRDPLQKIEGYRRAIQVDYAAELPHQKLSDVARELARAQRQADPSAASA